MELQLLAPLEWKEYYQTLPSNNLFYEPTGILDLLVTTCDNDDVDINLIMSSLSVLKFEMDNTVLSITDYLYVHNNNDFYLFSKPTYDRSHTFLQWISGKYNVSFLYRVDKLAKYISWIQLYIPILEHSQIIGISGWGQKKPVPWCHIRKLDPNNRSNECESIKTLCQQVHQTQVDRYNSFNQYLFDIPCLFPDIISIILHYLFVDVFFFK